MSGSLAGVELPAIFRLLKSWTRCVRLRLLVEDWSGELYFDSGELAAGLFGLARGLGGEPSDPLRGVSAVDTVVLLMPEAAFFLSGEASVPEWNITISPSELQARFENLQRERLGCKLTLASLLVSPVHTVTARTMSENQPLTMDRGKLSLLSSINGERTIIDLLRGTDVLNTIKNLDWLTKHGIIDIPGGCKRER
jgi:hypothetical protein